MEKPSKCYLEYLDGLRESGVTNMFGATPYLQGQFPELTKKDAREVLQFWMDSKEKQNVQPEN